uniref:Uncharacterized protein n=1 Tax=Timema bartmani TaxID=61472 RepID=A0A7R9F2W7_9NEOP|nr:unnamed protein product [Timema bartmani]
MLTRLGGVVGKRASRVEPDHRGRGDRGCLLEVCRGVCVLEVGVDNLGMVVNCRLKKSSIVRVRNLGGVKGYIDVGLSLGDEMGFKPTFAATEDRRRSPQGRRNVNQLNKGGKKSLVPASIPASKTPYKWLNASPQPKNGSAAAVAPQAFRKALQSASNHFLVRTSSQDS